MPITDKWTKTEYVTVTGDKTYEQYVGDFKFKTMLSHRDHLSEDRVRREYLTGPAGAEASLEAENTARVFAQLAVRIVDAPMWWRESSNGIDLPDNNVVAEVYKLALKAEADQLEALAKKAEEAKAKLAKPLVEETK